VGQKLAEVKIK